MQKSNKDLFIQKYNLQDGDSISDKEIAKSEKHSKSGNQKRNIYLQVKEIFKNYSKNFPPLYLIDRRDEKDNLEFEVGERHKETNHRRKSDRRKNNFDRRHPQNFDDKFSSTEYDRRSEFSDRRDWIDFERRKLDKRKVIQIIKRISEIIASYKARQSTKNPNVKSNDLPSLDEILLLIKEHLEEGYDFESSNLIYDILGELKLYILAENRFCGKIKDDSLGFGYKWIGGEKKFFVKELAEKEFPKRLKTTPSHEMDNLHCCIDFDPSGLESKCHVGFCTQYTSDIKRSLKKAILLKAVKNIVKKSR